MLSEITFLLLFLVTVVVGQEVPGGIDRSYSDEIKSLGYKVVYGDEDFVVINQVVSDVEKTVSKGKVRLNDSIKPLPSEDVKCLMSADHYCSKDMMETKSVIIQAIKNDCKECSVTQKEGAGKVIAAMMAHDPIAWKLFLTRTALQIRPEKKLPEPVPEVEQYKEVGEPEDVISFNRYALPGVKVRVKRYHMEKVGL